MFSPGAGRSKLQIDESTHSFSVSECPRIEKLTSLLQKRWLSLAGAVIGLCINTASANPAFVQANYAAPQVSRSLVGVSYANAQIAGDVNVVVIGWNDTTARINSVTDTAGNIYQLAIGPTQLSGSASQSIYYAKKIVGAPAGVGYRLHIGRASGNYSQIVDIGSSTAAAVSNPAGGTSYYFVVGAYNSAGVEGPYSNEVSYSAP
jgi:hypothetical protein